MNKEKKILFVYTNFSSFVEADYEILSSVHEVVKYKFDSKSGTLKNGVSLIRQFFYLLFNIWKFDAVYCWFADIHSFFPVIFARWLRKKSFAVVGGTDAVAIPDLKYGLFEANSFRKALGKIAIKNTSCLLPVDKSLIENTNYYATEKPEGLKVGLKNFVKNIKGEIIAMPTGYSSGFWNEQPDIERKKSVVTVGFIPDWIRWYLKGCDLLLELAKNMKETHFYIYGMQSGFFLELKQKLSIPPNLHLKSPVAINELPGIYSEHKVYAQFSLSEGLPNVLCESVLCGCVPVGSNVNGITTVIKNENLILNHKNMEDARKCILNAMNLPSPEIKKIHDYVKETFTIEKRKENILQLF